jgi:DNA-binding response OmpR family regulator
MTGTVLLVDDDPAIRELFSIYLGLSGYTSREADGGSACLEEMRNHRPDIIILDMMMEPMDGWETLQAIQNNPAWHEIPVLIITGKPPTVEEILRYGGLIEDFIIKPVDFGTVIGSLPRILTSCRVLASEINRVTGAGTDPETAAEYAWLLRMDRIVHNLKNQLGAPEWTDPEPFRHNRVRLLRLHRDLGFPDHLLGPEEGR